nr:Hypothetical protein FSTVLC9_274 [Faustovirus]
MALSLTQSQDSTKYAEKVIEYYYTEHKKLIHYDTIAADLRDKIIYDENFFSSMERMTRQLQIINYLYLFPKSGTTCAYFSFHYENTKANYAFLYITTPDFTDASLDTAFICTGPTFKSQDGEYRHRMLPMSQVMRVFEQYKTQFDIFIDNRMAPLNKGKFTLSYEICNSIKFNDSDKLRGYIKDNRLDVVLLAATWFVDYYHQHYNIIENHVEQGYFKTILYPNEELFETIVSSVGGIDNYRTLISKLTRFYFDHPSARDKFYHVECGQKLTPMTIRETYNIGDISLMTWREMYFDRMCSDLVMNFITPCVPFVGQWLILQNTSPGIFDNFAMHERYKNSETARKIYEVLEKADKLTYIDGSRNSGFVNNTFARLAASINKSILMNDSNIRLSGLVLCKISEYVGRTWRDIPNILVNSPAKASNIHQMMNDYDLFAKHMFEYVYTLYCMNSKLGLMQGDLHINNATTFKLYGLFRGDGTLIVDNPYILYSVGDTDYLFPHYGVFSCVIDFSRAITNNYNRVAADYGKHFAHKFFKEQQNRLKSLYRKFFENMYNKYETQMEALIDGKFNLMFKIATGLDTLTIFSSLKNLFETDPAFKEFKLDKSYIHLVDKIAVKVESIIVENIRAALDGKLTDESKIEYPNYTILKSEFVDYEYKKIKSSLPANYRIIDVFRYDNDLEYGSGNYSEYNPLLSLDGELNLMNKLSISSNAQVERWQRFKDTDETLDLELLTGKYARESEIYEQSVLYSSAY